MQKQKEMDGLGQAVDSLVISSNEFYGSPHLLPLQNDVFPLEAGFPGDWALVLIMISALFLAISRYYFPARITQFFRAAFATHHFNQMEREGGVFDETVTYLLFFNFLLVFSFLLWVSLHYFGWMPDWDFLNPLLSFFLVCLVLSLFFLLKSLFLSFLSWVFNTRQSTQTYLKNIFLFNQLMGLVLLPVVGYAVYHPTKTGILIAWGVWVLANLVKIARGAYLGHNVSGLSGYYLILYLCAIEFAPLLVFLKVADNYLIPG
ncbi:MAG: DUF4271 domain-containing protein [Bacteroidales bacterium]